MRKDLACSTSRHGCPTPSTHRWVVDVATPAPTRAISVVRQWDDHQFVPTATDDVLPWELGLEHLDLGRVYWSTVHGSDGAAHVRPVFAVVEDGMLYTTSSADARKFQFVLADPRSVLATSTEGMDLVYEGIATPVRDRDVIEAIAECYRSKYGWPVTATAAGFDAPFGAPSAGVPPYRVIEVRPTAVYGFGTDERWARRSTRWDFA